MCGRKIALQHIFSHDPAGLELNTRFHNNPLKQHSRVNDNDNDDVERPIARIVQIRMCLGLPVQTWNEVGLLLLHKKAGVSHAWKERVAGAPVCCGCWTAFACRGRLRRDVQFSFIREKMNSVSSWSWAPFMCVVCAVAVGTVGVVVAIVFVGRCEEESLLASLLISSFSLGSWRLSLVVFPLVCYRSRVVLVQLQNCFSVFLRLDDHSQHPSLCCNFDQLYGVVPLLAK